MRVIIAEDERTSRRILASSLESWGYEVVATADGDEAWSEFQKEDAPQLAILDWMMPGISGDELVKRVRGLERGVNTYLILLTGMNSKDDIVKGLEAGADEYLTKPYDNAELRARVGVGVRVINLQNALQKRLTELQEAIDHIKALQGIIPICMHCHKIRSDEESWERIESYIEDHSGAEFSHGLCPDCLDKFYPEEEDEEEPVTESSTDCSA